MMKNDSRLKIPFIWPIGVLTFLFILAVPGCGTMTILLGDPIRYRISGTVREANDIKDSPVLGNHKAILNVDVTTSCKGIESSMYQNRKGVTNENGHYQLEGYGGLEGCTVSFSHKAYQPITILIDESHLVRREGLSRTYEVDVRLTRRTTDK